MSGDDRGAEAGGERSGRPSRGIVYLAMSEDFVHEAALSAASTRRHLQLPITVFTDCPAAAEAARVFDSVVELQRSGPRAHRDKIVAMRRTPYVWTLFLDTDTFVGAPLDDCWDLLAHFDLVAAGDRGYVDDFPPGTGVPTSFKEPNLGVVFYRRSPLIEHMLDQALAYYDELATPRDGGAPISQYDQPAIRLALYRSALRLGTLSEEDNCRFANYGKLNGPVRVLHGRLPRAAHTPANLQRVMDRLNATTVPRVFVAGRAWALWPHRLPYTHNYRAMRLRRFNVIEMRPVLAAVRAQARRVVRRVLRF